MEGRLPEPDRPTCLIEVVVSPAPVVRRLRLLPFVHEEACEGLGIDVRLHTEIRFLHIPFRPKVSCMSTKQLSWMAACCVAGILLLLGGLLLEETRTEARKMTSANNLKQLGLALANYSDAYRSLPAGCDSQAKHGWLTTISPYVEASPWYNKVDWDVSWEHPFNVGQFRANMPVYRMPGRDDIYTSEGWTVTHYAANSVLLNQGRYIKSKDLPAEWASIIIAGEVSTQIAPFGYTQNWRAVTFPIGSVGGFNGWSDGTQFVMGDGSVRWLSNATNARVVEALRGTKVLPESEPSAQPKRSFTLSRQAPPDPTVYYGPEHKEGKFGASYVTVWSNISGEPEYIDFISGYFDCTEVFELYPHVKVLRFVYPRTQADLHQVANLKKLEYLCLMSRVPVLGEEEKTTVSMDDLIAALKLLPNLKVIEMKRPLDGFERLQAELPQVQFIESRKW